MIDLDYHRFILQLVWVGGDLLQSIAKLTLRTVLMENGKKITS